MKKINWKPVGEFIGTACAALYGMALGYAAWKTTGCIGEHDETSNANYIDAVEAIMDSSMWSDAKADVMDVLKRHENSDYYGAVIQIVKSSTFSDNKVKMIKSLSEK